MINFRRHVLENGLTVISYHDPNTPLVSVNTLYKVGSKNDPIQKTGMAHLLEHMMFTGSKHAPDFDRELQMASGENNAFTNADITNYYETLPASNIDTALWLESDRMQHLSLSASAFQTQQSVVIEEFKETCLNQPYGMVWHHLMDMTYTTHSYRWPTIGIDLDHISSISLSDLQRFYDHYYQSDNAVLVIGGGIEHGAALDKAKRWFGDCHSSSIKADRLTITEPEQQQFRYQSMDVESSMEIIYLAFPMTDRLHPEYYQADLLSDVLGNGRSSKLYQPLVLGQQILISIDAFITGVMDNGLFIIEGRLSKGVSHDRAFEEIWKVLDEIKSDPIHEKEMQKVYHQTISSMAFTNVSLLNKVMNLAYFEALGNANLINEEADIYGKVNNRDILKIARHLLRREKCSRLDVKAL